MIWEHILEITFLNEPDLVFAQLNGFKYCYITDSISHLFAGTVSSI